MGCWERIVTNDALELWALCAIVLICQARHVCWYNSGTTVRGGTNCFPIRFKVHSEGNAHISKGKHPWLERS